MEERSKELKVMIELFCARFEVVSLALDDEMRVGRCNNEDRNATQNSYSN
jgi:hypothetical protein